MELGLCRFEEDAAAARTECWTVYRLRARRDDPALRTKPDPAAHALPTANDLVRLTQELDDLLFIHGQYVGVTGIDCHNLSWIEAKTPVVVPR